MSTMRDITVAAFLILFVGLSYCLKKDTAFESSAKLPLFSESLRSGDIIFRRGPSLESEVLMSMDGAADFSHVGVVLRERDETFVIHVVTREGGPDVTKREPIHDYLRADRATAAMAYRLIDDNPSRIAHAVEAAGEYVERQAPFDGDFDLTSEHALYCTELVWRAYQSAGVDLVDESLPQPTTSLIKHPILWPSILLHSKHLTAVWEWSPRKKD
jgi:hypothetical protein